MKKKIFGMMLALCMVLAVLPRTAFAAGEMGSAEGFDYEILPDDTVKIIKYDRNKPAGKLAIPAKLDGRDVTVIAADTFEENNTLQSLILPAGLKTIEYEAFCTCKNLESVEFPESQKTIESQAFNACFKLKAVTIPKNVETIEELAFGYCYQLEEVTIPKSVETIGETAFAGCNNLETVTILSKTAAIGANAFANEDFSAGGSTSGYVPNPVLKTVNYAGTEEEWNTAKGGRANIDLGIGEECTVNYNYVPYEVIEGGDATWKPESGKDLTVHAKGDFDDFLGIQVDGEDVASENYEAKEGSTIVTLKKSYLATLPAGAHEMTMLFNYGECTADFTTAAAETPAKTPTETPAEEPAEKPAAPQTGDTGTAIWTVLGTLAAFGAADIVLRKKNSSR